MKKSVLRRLGAVLPPLMFCFALTFFGVLYGMAASEMRWFPYYTLVSAQQLPNALFPFHRPFFWEFRVSDKPATITVQKPEQMQAGLTKVVELAGDLSLAIRVIDSAGKMHQQWMVEWSRIWPETPTPLQDAPDLPRSRPGTHIHGAQIVPNGDLVFNFEHLALVRLNPCGETVWKLPIRSHHAVFVDDDQNIWVPAQRNHTEPLPKLPFLEPTIIEPMILKLSPQGDLLEERSVFDLLMANQLQGLLYSTSARNFTPVVTADILHLNDVDVFPAGMASGFFQPGDVMISLRNVNSVLVFDREWRLKYQWANEFVRQHDPDFIDGNTLRLFDNNNVAPIDSGVSSRILERDVRSGTTRTVFAGSEQTPFFTNIMGKFQSLENGNLLISESIHGRAFELSPQQELVWEYNNLVEPGWIGIMEEAERLPPALDSAFFERARARCENPAVKQ